MQTRPSEEELAYFAGLISAGNPNPHNDPPAHLSDPDYYLKRLDYHGITLLAAEYGCLPAELETPIQQRKAMMVANNVLKQSALIELFDAFAMEGLSNGVLFKGSALAYSVYKHPWLRPRTDSDYLIDKADLPAYSDVFRSLGYEKLFALEGDYVSYQSTFSKPLAGDSFMNIDLHWRINNRQSLARTFTVKELKRKGRVLNSLTANITIPNPVDSLLIAALHRLGHHQNEERLTWLNDIHLLASDLDEEQWRNLVSKARQKQLCAITLDALSVCSALLMTEVPEWVVNELSLVQNESSRVFLQRELPEWRYFLADLRAINGWRGKLSLLRENVVPDPDYVRRQMQTNSAIKGYVRRFIRGLRRVT